MGVISYAAAATIAATFAMTQRRRSRSQGVGQDQGQGRQTHFGRGLKVCHCMVSYVRS